MQPKELRLEHGEIEARKVTHVMIMGSKKSTILIYSKYVTCVPPVETPAISVLEIKAKNRSFER